MIIRGIDGRDHDIESVEAFTYHVTSQGMTKSSLIITAVDCRVAVLSFESKRLDVGFTIDATTMAKFGADSFRELIDFILNNQPDDLIGIDLSLLSEKHGPTATKIAHAKGAKAYRKFLEGFCIFGEKETVTND